MTRKLALVMTCALALAACGKDPAAQAAREHSGGKATYASPSHDGEQASGDAGVDHRKEAAPKAEDGKPIWSANRQRSAEDNAKAAFERNGEAFGAKDLDDFVAKAHAFVNHPPKGAERIDRANGDVELYDAKTNVFAVATKDGAPRTIFKPDNGAAYWEKEKAKAADQSDSGGDRGYKPRRKRGDAEEG